MTVTQSCVHLQAEPDLKTCTIEIRDEVNCKLLGLDLDVRKKLVSTFKYEIPGARFQPAVRLGRWDGKVAYVQLGGSTYINLLPDIIPILERFDYDIELVDHRTYSTVFHFDQVCETRYGHVLWPKGHPAEGQPMVLRDYQVEVINKFLQNPQCIQEIATGSGKTVITAALSDAVSAHGRSIVIVPNKSLVTQTEKDYRNMGLDVGVYFGDRKEFNRKHTICTWQSLNTLLKQTLNGTAEVTIQDFIDDVVCVIVDECFAGETPVLTPTGYVPIRNLRAGDRIINYSEKTKRFKEDVVVKQHRNLPKSAGEKMYRLEFDNGVILEVTGNHKFLTNTGWCRADELSDQHEIINTPN